MENQHHTPNSRDIIDPREAAEMLGMHEQTIRRMLFTGKIPGHRFGTQWRLRRSAIYNMIPEGLPSAHEQHS